MTPEERSSAANGIWLCDVHARAVDANDPQFTVDVLRSWKKKTDEDSWRSVMHDIPFGPGMTRASPDELSRRLRAAAVADLSVFRRTAKWPATTVALTLKVHQIDDPLSSRALASAVTTLDDLILVAPPGMGKTTTLFQIAEGILETERGVPLVVPLGDWATEGASLLESILQRPAFCGVTAADLRTLATKPGVVLLLDGWNELDAVARSRARVQVGTLKAELPELGLVISARKQEFDVPIPGTRVDLLPLSEEQQMEIAKAMRGDVGMKIIDQAWRTAGIRELVTIPLYLASLLALPEGSLFPATKEEVLRRFVAAHENEARHAEVLRRAVEGHHQAYLNALAVLITKSFSTAMGDRNARKSISDMAHMLVADGQITAAPQPNTVLDALVSNHVLMRSGDTPGYSFQHQQFQEWYASHYVEELMIAAATDVSANRKLKADVLDCRPWEESVLFSVERMARAGELQQQACSAAILAAFEVDPMLSAEMIFRATDDIWATVSLTLKEIVQNWHKPGKVDRALHFMIASGRPEFLDSVWPLISHESSQVMLPALRAARRFRSSLLGIGAEKRIAALPTKSREILLSEIVFNSGMDGIDLATATAKSDGDPRVKVAVVNALEFRRADRHITELLSEADDKTYDLLAAKGLIENVHVASVQSRLEAARARHKFASVSAHERLRSLLYASGSEDRSDEILLAVADLNDNEIAQDRAHLLYEVNRRNPRSLADGLLRRLREHRSLFYGADDLLAAAGVVLEDDELLAVALADTRRFNDRADAAASVLGPLAVGHMVQVYLEARKRLRRNDGRYDESASKRLYALEERIGHTPGASLIAAVRLRASMVNNEEIAELADLLSRPIGEEDDRSRPFNAAGLAEMRSLATNWGERTLASGDASRLQLGSIARLIARAPSVTMLPLLKKLLDENLRRFRIFREEAKASKWREGKALDEARDPQMHYYQEAFLAIKAPETTDFLKAYLSDEHFGQLAAFTMVRHWLEANGQQDDKSFRGNVDFSRIAERRAALVADPSGSSREADAIFQVIDLLIAGDSSEEQKKLAVELAIAAAQLPHGQRYCAFQKLVLFASRQRRAALLLGLVLSGEIIDVKAVEEGIAEVFEAAKKQRWILEDGHAYQLKDWLRLLPFVNQVSKVPDIVRSLPDAQRDPEFLKEIVRGLGDLPSVEAEEVLFKLAEDDSRFRQDYNWLSVVMRLGTLSAALRLVDVLAVGASNDLSERWYLTRELSGLVARVPGVRPHIYDLLRSERMTPGLSLLADAIAENPDAEGLLLLIDLGAKHEKSLVPWHTIENTVVERLPFDGQDNMYNIVPVAAVDLRKKLLAMTTCAETRGQAVHCLSIIEETRDRYGAPLAEPRHPDLASGRPWPILTFEGDMPESSRGRGSSFSV